MPNMVHVDSRNLYAVGYDPIACTLYVTFRSGGTYAYFGVPESTHRELMMASSKGQYHHRFIKYAYPYQRM